MRDSLFSFAFLDKFSPFSVSATNVSTSKPWNIKKNQDTNYRKEPFLWRQIGQRLLLRLSVNICAVHGNYLSAQSITVEVWFKN